MAAAIPRFLCACAATFLIAGSTLAQTGESARIGSGARPLALGEAFSAVANDATAAFWNPAGLATLEAPEFSLDFRRLTSSLSLESASAAFRPRSYEPLVLGVAGSFLNRYGVATEDGLGNFLGDSGAYEFAGSLNLATRVHPRLQLGIAAGGLVSTLANQGKQHAWSGSAGLLWDAWGNQVGVAMRGLTSKIDDEALVLPYRYRFSAGVARYLAPPLLLTLQVDRDRGADAVLAGGSEWTHVTGVSLRAGARRLLADVADNKTYSGGVGYRREKVRADYALVAGQRRRPEHVVSIGVQLGRAELPDVRGAAAAARHWEQPLVEKQQEHDAPVTAAPEVSESQAPRAGSERPSMLKTRDVEPPRPTGALDLQPWVPSMTKPESLQAATPRARAQVGRRIPAARAGKPKATPTRSRLESPPQQTRLQARRVDPRPQLPNPPPRSAERPVVTPQAMPPAAEYSGRFVVRAGVYLDMDEAALEVAHFYRAQLRPRLERRGELYVVVLRRCQTRDEAESWLQRARAAGVRCTIDEE